MNLSNETTFQGKHPRKSTFRIQSVFKVNRRRLGGNDRKLLFGNRKTEEAKLQTKGNDQSATKDRCVGPMNQML